jgi:pyruvate/2-oxoglutarate dehydrogenase complex dihydrolipoamide acyltransferase (E2) component
MPRNVYLPQWGMGMSDATIIKWLVNEGDLVKKGDHLVEVESSKVNAEIESPAEGKIGKIKSQEGEVVKVGEVVAIIVGEGEKLVDSDEADKSVSDSEKKDLKVNKQTPPDASQITPRARKLAQAQMKQQKILLE